MTGSTGAPPGCRKNKLIITITGILLVACVFACLFLIPWRWHDDVIRNVRVWQMSPAQRQCAQQFAGNLAFVEQQADGNSLAIGYLVRDDYYVAMYSTGAQGQCDVEFHEKVGHLDTFAPGEPWEEKAVLEPKVVRKVRLSNSDSPEIYVWFDAPGVNKHHAAKHLFYVKQSDGSYKAVLSLELCVGLSTVEIMNERDTPTIMVTDDRLCDWPRSQRLDYIEYSLSDGKPQIIRAWGTGYGP